MLLEEFNDKAKCSWNIKWKGIWKTVCVVRYDYVNVCVPLWRKEAREKDWRVYNAHWAL